MKVQIDPYTMTSGDVARVIDATDETVRRHDDVPAEASSEWPAVLSA